MFLNRKDGIADSFCGCGHSLDHISVCLGEAGIVFEEVAVSENVGDDQLILDEGVAVEQESVARIGVNDELVNFA